MSRPTHILKHEHRVIEQGLRALDGLCLKLRMAENVEPEALAKLFDFFQHFAAGIHHNKEEAYLFPALKQIGVRENGGILGFLCDEHGIERRLLAELEMLIDRYRNADATVCEQFVETAMVLRDHLVGHIEQEDAVLFTLAEEMLDETVKSALLKSFASDGDGEVVKRYEQMALELENEWSV